MAEDKIAELERKLLEAKNHAMEERRQREEAEQQTRCTTLVEYIQYCHDLLFTRFAVETNKSLTSKGSVTNPQNKLCPTHLVPWVDFLDQQKTTFGILHSTFPAQIEAFESRNLLLGLGERISKKKIANEKDLEYFHHIGIEYPVKSIVERLAAEDAVRDAFSIGNGIVFETHLSALRDVNEEVVDRHAAQLPPVTPGQPRPHPNADLDLNTLRPDQICVYKEDGNPGRRILAYVIEYKAPHKLTLPHLRLGLRQMDIYREVINRPTKPTAADSEALFRYYADWLVAAVVTQTFHYMIQGGLEYGFMTTGEAIVFLKIDWADPTTIYYHLAEPKEEVLAHGDNRYYCTAVSQILAFSLIALGSPGQQRSHGQKERAAAEKRLRRWTVDYKIILQSTKADGQMVPPSTIGYVPITYKEVDRSPRVVRVIK
ncbi:hypothetical protein F5X99DRAFT_430823 [Biscogniauxia marginata]|nr:hypothetical protein F5X99DRAFT_430823 [Biscogniauxia marginata]